MRLSIYKAPTINQLAVCMLGTQWGISRANYIFYLISRDTGKFLKEIHWGLND